MSQRTTLAGAPYVVIEIPVGFKRVTDAQVGDYALLSQGRADRFHARHYLEWQQIKTASDAQWAQESGAFDGAIIRRVARTRYKEAIS